VNVISEPLAGSTVADLILNEAKTADLLVMGAYGGSELIEKIFGGVTESVHAKCETPVLFAK
jgi:nucleotide-binding universal stress UspA family protein